MLNIGLVPPLVFTIVAVYKNLRAVIWNTLRDGLNASRSFASVLSKAAFP